MHQLEFVDLRADYGHAAVLEGISFGVDKGEIVSLIGPSGSGKSTLLRVLVGLLPPSGGCVLLDGQEVDFRDKAAVRSVRSRTAIVFQQYNLFQNMDVLANVTIAPVKVKGQPRAEVDAYARQLLERVGLGHKLHAFPDQLSGGQQQRVAIARALAPGPSVLLLDEPTSALDPALVNEVLEVIRRLAIDDGLTMIISTHQIRFADEVADRVAFLSGGSIIEEGPAHEVLTNPSNPLTARFLSVMEADKAPEAVR